MADQEWWRNFSIDALDNIAQSPVLAGLQQPSKALGSMGRWAQGDKNAFRLKPGSSWQIDAPGIGEFAMEGLERIGERFPHTISLGGTTVPDNMMTRLGGMLPESFSQDNPYIQSVQDTSKQLGGMGIEGLALARIGQAPAHYKSLLAPHKINRNMFGPKVPKKPLDQFRSWEDLVDPDTLWNLKHGKNPIYMDDFLLNKEL